MAKRTSRRRTDEARGLGDAAARSWEVISGGLGAALSNAGRLIAASVVLAVTIAWIAGVGPLRDAVAHQQANPIRVVFDWPRAGAAPRDVGEAVRADMEQRVLGAVTVDPFDRASLERARTALEASGWFQGSPVVARRPGGVVRVSGAWRTPVAVVVQGTTEYLVDDAGAPLCLPIGGKPGAKLFRIRRPWGGPPERDGAIAYGEPWRGGDVQMAIELLATIAEHPDLAAKIAGVDLSNCLHSGANELRLETGSGAMLVWGAPPSAPAIGEVTTANKLRHLEYVLSGTVPLDRPGAPINLHLPVIEIDQTAATNW